MLKRLVTFGAALFLLPLLAQADMLPDNYHTVQTCFRIDNASSYANYEFSLTGQSNFPFTAKFVKGSYCESGKGFTDARIIAINKGDLKNLKYLAAGSEEEGSWPNLPENQEFISWSDLRVSAAAPVPDTNPLTKQDVMLHIDSISGGIVKVRNASDVAASAAAAAPAPAAVVATPASSGTPSALAFGIALAGLIGVIAVFVLWRKRSS